MAPDARPHPSAHFALWRESQDMRVRTRLGGIFYLLAWLLTWGFSSTPAHMTLFGSLGAALFALLLALRWLHRLPSQDNAASLGQWIDRPQKLWDAVYETLVSGIDTVIHVGPETNLLPATFKRLSDNVQQQLQGRSINSLSLRAMSGIVGRPWLGKVLSSRTALLRAPFVRHILLEDWLLDRDDD